MGWLSGLKSRASAATDEASKKWDGTLDFLQGLSSGCAFMASADGDIDADERRKSIDVIRRVEGIDGRFDQRTIEVEFERRCGQTTDRSGRDQLRKELNDVAKRDPSGKLGEKIVYAALDVAEQSGGISDKEKARGLELAKLCGISEQRYGEMIDA